MDSPSRASTRKKLKATDILETCLYCRDLKEAESFYSGVLGLELTRKQEGRHLFFRCGERMLLIFNAAKTSGDSVTPHGATGSVHVAFGASHEELDAWKSFLPEKGISIEDEVSWPGGGRSIYFRDPSGNCLEFVTPDTWGL